MLVREHAKRGAMRIGINIVVLLRLGAIGFQDAFTSPAGAYPSYVMARDIVATATAKEIVWNGKHEPRMLHHPDWLRSSFVADFPFHQEPFLDQQINKVRQSRDRLRFPKDLAYEAQERRFSSRDREEAIDAIGLSLTTQLVLHEAYRQVRPAKDTAAIIERLEQQ